MPLEKGMATHSSVHTWRIPWTEEPGGLQSKGRKELDATEQLTNRGDSGDMYLHVNTNAYTFSFKHQGFSRVSPVSCKSFTWLYLHSFLGELSIICSSLPEFLHQTVFNILIQKFFQLVDRVCPPPHPPRSLGFLEQVSSRNRKSHLHLQSFPQPCITGLPKSSHCWQYLATDGWLLSQLIFSHWF